MKSFRRARKSNSNRGGTIKYWGNASVNNYEIHTGPNNLNSSGYLLLRESEAMFPSSSICII